MELSLELCFFPGFYESALMDSDTSYWAIKEELEYLRDELSDEHPEYRNLTENDLDFRYRDYERDVAERFVSAWEWRAPSAVVESVEFDEIVSPRYYNFSNDRLFGKVKLRDGWEDEMRNFIAENEEWLKERVHDDWTSYDGFCSFMDNDLDEWPEHLFVEHDERYISTMIGYMMIKEHNGKASYLRDELVMDALDDIYAGSYVFITDEAKERLAEDIREGRVVIPDPNQLEIPFPEEN